MPRVNVSLDAEAFAEINAKILNKGNNSVDIKPTQNINVSDYGATTPNDIFTGDFWVQAAKDGLQNLKNISGFAGVDSLANRNSAITDAKNQLVKNINILLNNSLSYNSDDISAMSQNFGKADIFGGIASVIGGLLGATNKTWLTNEEKVEVDFASYDSFSTKRPEVTIKDFNTKNTYNGIPFEVQKILDSFEKELKTKDYNDIFSSSDGETISAKDRNDKEIENAINNRKEIGSIGYLYIKPIADIDDVAPVKIPFEFNPKISEGSLQAKYSATSFLSRVGEVQNYTGTSSTTLTISTSYEIMSDGAKNQGTHDDWMNLYTAEYIDKIEAAYRSLVFPYFKEENNAVIYIRPPVIKIILYENEEDISEYKNSTPMEYTYPNKMNYSIFLKSQANQIFRQHKTFVASSVTINKSEESKNFYIKDKIIRYSGFDVELNLIEVTEDYTDVIPDFITYYNRYKGLS